MEIRAEGRDPAEARQRIEQLPGISRVLLRDSEPGRAMLEVETLESGFVRGDLARTVVQAGWNLEELRTAATSLEDVFLQLTGSEKAKAQTAVEPVAEVIQ